MSYRKRKKQALPAFCDATAHVSASQFGAQRLPELTALYRAATTIGNKRSDSGVDVSGGDNRVEPKKNAAGKVQIEALISGGRKTSSRHLRRRATSHKSRKRYRVFKHGSKKQMEVETNATQSRKTVRQNMAALEKDHGQWKCSQVEYNLDSDHSSSDVHETKQQQRQQAVHWMATHVWHAKRFRMAPLWGWNVPVMHSNRGCAAALRLALEGKCLISDATWCMQPIRLQTTNTTMKRDLQTSIKRIISNFDDESTCAMHVMQSGMLHRLDCFPKDAIGPVSWIWTTRAITDSTSSDSNSTTAFVYFFVHPSILSLAMECLRSLIVTRLNIDGPFQGVDGGLACFKYRGLDASSCLQRSLPQVLTSKNTDALTCFLKKGRQAAELSDIPWIQVYLDGHPTRPVYIRRVHPRNSELPCNQGVCGFDILCSPQVAKQIFHVSILNGAACPIGIAEEAFIELEAEQPLLVFPRDYPDTDQGRQYWGFSNKNWNYIRRHLEGGGGRIRVTEKVISPVIWSDLVGEKATVVLVRGAFVDLFRRTLRGATAHSSESRCESAKRRRKNRRSSKESCFVVEAMRLSKEKSLAHVESCKSLAITLSLPALLVCHVQIAGKGTLQAGAPLFSLSDQKPQTLGYVTIGAFSTSRGRTHGVALIGAALFLEAISNSGKNGPIVIVRGSKGANAMIGFRVRIGGNGASQVAIATLHSS